MRALGLLLLVSIALSGWTVRAAAAPPPRAREPFLLGGIQLNESDHERWSAALLRSGMNAVEVTVYAHQGAWHGPRMWFADEEPAVLAEIRTARRNGLQVVLVLRVALDHDDPENRFLWHGLTWPGSEAELAEWFRRYTAFVVKWARIAQAEGVEVVAVASEMNALAATLPVAEVPELAAYYLDDAKLEELRALVGRHRHLFDDDDRLAMGAGDFDLLDDFLVARNRAERRWAGSYSFAGEDDRIGRINHRRRLLLGHWERLIDAVRSVYGGYLTLAANFDNYHEIAFWDRLDLIGINAYFPLRATPESPLGEAELTAAWRAVLAEIESFKTTHGLEQKVIFTELGYTRRSGVTFAPWSSAGFVPIWGGEEHEDRVLLWSRQPEDRGERALAVRALYAAWREDPSSLAGILYWKLSSRLELERYEPFMLYLGPEAGDPLFDALTLFAGRVRPFESPFASADERYARWARAVVLGDLGALTELPSRPGKVRAPPGTLPLLHLAVRSGHGDVVRHLLERGARRRSRDAGGRLPLHWSCYQQDPSLVAILAPWAGVSWRDAAGETPLMKCARLDNAAVLRELLRLRPGPRQASLVRARNRDGQTALSLAADQASAETIALLIAHGGGVDEVDASGATPLHVAARRGDPAIVEVLSAAAAGDALDPAGNRPVDYAAYFGQAEAFRLLWRGGQARHRNAGGQTLLHLAAHGGDVAILDVLLAEDVDVNLPDGDGRTPLHHAVIKTHRDAVLRLLEHGAAVDRADAQGRTALHWAAERDDPLLLRLVLASSPDVDAADAGGNTPLHYAAAWGRVENARLLLAAGARPEAKNAQGQTALEVGQASGRKRVVELLKGWIAERR